MTHTSELLLLLFWVHDLSQQITALAWETLSPKEGVKLQSDKLLRSSSRQVCLVSG
jgi:hypothetical protein